MTRRWLIAAVTGMLLLNTMSSAAAADTSPPAPVPAAPTPTPTPTPAPAPIKLAGEPIRYDDVPEDHWAYWSVAKLREAGILSSAPSGLFRPTEPILRSELFKMVLAARRINTEGQCSGFFVDAPCGVWFTPTAEMAYRLAIAEGQGESIFAPNANVTRQELFTIIVRALGQRWEAASLGWPEINATLNSFGDQAEIAYWARPAAALAVRTGLTRGYTDGTFRPTALATRAEVAAVISKIMLPAQAVKTTEVDGRQIAYKQAFDMVATMYATGEPGVGTITYTGVRVRIGTVAVDPTVIPLGSLLYIEGYGYAVAADIGSAIKGQRVDLFTHDYDEAAVRFGMQPRKVWLLH